MKYLGKPGGSGKGNSIYRDAVTFDALLKYHGRMTFYVILLFYNPDMTI